MKKVLKFVNVQGGVDSDVMDVTGDLVDTPYERATRAA